MAAICPADVAKKDRGSGRALQTRAREVRLDALTKQSVQIQGMLYEAIATGRCIRREPNQLGGREPARVFCGCAVRLWRTRT